MDLDNRAQELAREADRSEGGWYYWVPEHLSKRPGSTLLRHDHTWSLVALGGTVGLTLGLLAALHAVPAGAAEHVGGLVVVAVALAAIMGTAGAWVTSRLMSGLRQRFGYAQVTAAGTVVATAADKAMLSIQANGGKESKKFAKNHSSDVFRLLDQEHDLALKVRGFVYGPPKGWVAHRSASFAVVNRAREKLAARDFDTFQLVEKQRRDVLVEAARVAALLQEIAAAEEAAYKAERDSNGRFGSLSNEVSKGVEQVDTRNAEDHVGYLRSLADAYQAPEQVRRLRE